MVLAGKTALITGGTGGLGAGVVAALLAAGAAVDVPHRSEEQFARLRDQIGATSETALSGGLLDLTAEADVLRYYEDVARQSGGIDILVNIAGGFGGGKPVHETEWAVWQEQLDMNLKTAVLSSRAAVPSMLARGGGSIVNVGTRPAVQPVPTLAAYAAAKAAVLHLTETMAAELRDQHITVNSVLPSVIDTPTNRKFNPDADYSAWVTPDEIARVILFLVGPDARVISGAHIPVYGRA
jgi:NAD(P)-dependent dehydrogenase (short-subunit alcohol dehydrogenase family)